jgi:hypothetical protein
MEPQYYDSITYAIRVAPMLADKVIAGRRPDHHEVRRVVERARAGVLPAIDSLCGAFNVLSVGRWK